MLNISFHYRPLYILKFLHEYYPEELLTDFIIIPSAKTVDKVRRLGLITKINNNTLTLLFEEEKSELLSTLPTEELIFSFFIYTNNTYFQNFTDLPIEIPEGKILYFSNQKQKKSGTISTKELVSEKDYIDKSEIKEAFPAEHPIKKPIAYVELFIPESIRNEITNQTPFEDLPQFDYSLKFPTRKTYWKYAFVCKHRKLENKAEITSSEGIPVTFSRMENEILLNQQEAIIFISSEPMALKQRSEYNLKLTQKDRVNKSSEIIPRLPVAGIEMVKPESRNLDAKIVSEIVIYL